MFDTAIQLVVAGLINGSFYALLGVAFGLILGVTGRFHYAFGLVFTLAAYVTAVTVNDAGAPIGIGIIAGLGAAMILGMGIELFVYRPLAERSGQLSFMTVLIAALGLSIAGINLIVLTWGTLGRTITLVPTAPIRMGVASITTLDLLVVVISWLLIAGVALLLERSAFGRAVKAVRGNPALAEIIGIDPRMIFLQVFALGSLLTGAAGILQGSRFAVIAQMGDRPVLIAFVIAFLGGPRNSPWLVAGAGIFVGMVEALSGLWVTPQWSSLVVFGILFIYLVFRALDLSRLKLARRAS